MGSIVVASIACRQRCRNRRGESGGGGSESTNKLDHGGSVLDHGSTGRSGRGGHFDGPVVVGSVVVADGISCRRRRRRDTESDCGGIGSTNVLYHGSTSLVSNGTQKSGRRGHSDGPVVVGSVVVAAGISCCRQRWYRHG